MEILKKFVSIATLIALSGCDYLRDPSYFDSFFDHKLLMKSDKTHYVIGDTISLIAIITPEEAKNIRLYQDRTKSFSLRIRALKNGETHFSDNNFSTPFKLAKDGDVIDTIQISPSEPYHLKIEGRILKDTNDNVVFDFDEFGTLTKNSTGNFWVGGYWKSINHAPYDPLEDFTEHINISVK